MKPTYRIRPFVDRYGALFDHDVKNDQPAVDFPYIPRFMPVSHLKESPVIQRRIYERHVFTFKVDDYRRSYITVYVSEIFFKIALNAKLEALERWVCQNMAWLATYGEREIDPNYRKYEERE